MLYCVGVIISFVDCCFENIFERGMCLENGKVIGGCGVGCLFSSCFDGCEVVIFFSVLILERVVVIWNVV